jgi:hypothetical protein
MPTGTTMTSAMRIADGLTQGVDRRNDRNAVSGRRLTLATSGVAVVLAGGAFTIVVLSLVLRLPGR